jgi:hypothetical protein
MIYSKKKKFLFIHIPKTAGTSLREVFGVYGSRPGPANFLARRVHRVLPSLTKNLSYRWMTFDPHLKFSEAQSLLPAEEISGCLKFCFVRNPFDRMVSFYRHIQRHPEHPFHAKISAWGGFHGMVTHLADLAEPGQFDYTLDRSGKHSMDMVGKFENLTSDFSKIASRLGIPGNLPHRNSAPASDWRGFYNGETRLAVVEFYRSDFEAFGYSPEIK